jgi:hypothetical protein
MIIGINGKIGSGKDTVGKIIQWLTKPELDGQYVGFQTYDDVTLERCSPFKIKKFAGKLKTTASLLTGIPVEKFEDQEFKKQEMPEEWWYKNVYDAGWDKKWTKETINYPTHTFTESHIVKTTYRQFLQNLGTEAMRDGLHTNVWVNALFADYKGIITEPAKFGGTAIGEYPNWVITDMRFPNEMDAVKQREGITIRVVRDYALRGGPEDPKNQHPSETALDDSHFDYEIINDGTIEDLIEKVREILIKEDVI